MEKVMTRKEEEGEICLYTSLFEFFFLTFGTTGINLNEKQRNMTDRTIRNETHDLTVRNFQLDDLNDTRLC